MNYFLDFLMTIGLMFFVIAIIVSIMYAVMNYLGQVLGCLESIAQSLSDIAHRYKKGGKL